MKVTYLDRHAALWAKYNPQMLHQFTTTIRSYIRNDGHPDIDAQNSMAASPNMVAIKGHWQPEGEASVFAFNVSANTKVCQVWSFGRDNLL